jgi:phenylacetate-coenzyme A ligase PaaK-like adenylate-forming protein
VVRSRLGVGSLHRLVEARGEEQPAGRLRLDRRGTSTSSVPLLSEARWRIESAFGDAPFNLYGTAEGLWGCDCSEHAGVHLFEGMCPRLAALA